MRFAITIVLAFSALAVSRATFSCESYRNCCMKNHSTCKSQRQGGIGVCSSSSSVYCSNCGADCCTYDPSYAIYNDDVGSVWTSSPTLTGTYCKS